MLVSSDEVVTDDLRFLTLALFTRQWVSQVSIAVTHAREPCAFLFALVPAFTFTLWDLTRCMLRAGVLGRILPHPSTVHRMFVLTSLLSSVMLGLMISRDCGSGSSWLFVLCVVALSAAEAAMFLCWQSILCLDDRPSTSVEWTAACRPSVLPERLFCHLPLERATEAHPVQVLHFRFTK